MNVYSVYTSSSKNKEQPIFVKQGFSIYAAIFKVFWAIYHRLWLIVFIFFLVQLLVNQLGNDYKLQTTNIAFTFMFAFLGTESREHKLLSQGYEIKDIIIAQDEDDAELKFLTRQIEAKEKNDYERI